MFSINHTPGNVLFSVFQPQNLISRADNCQWVRRVCENCCLNNNISRLLSSENKEQVPQIMATCDWPWSGRALTGNFSHLFWYTVCYIAITLSVHVFKIRIQLSVHILDTSVGTNTKDWNMIFYSCCFDPCRGRLQPLRRCCWLYQAFWT